VGLNSLKSLNLTNFYPNNKKKNKKKNNKVKSKPLELFELAGKKCSIVMCGPKKCPQLLHQPVRFSPDHSTLG
jgi:hypothetical protein